MVRTFMPALLIAAVAAISAASPAAAADNAMQVCGAKYQAAKTAKSLPAGQTWPQFLAQCRSSLPKTAAPVAVSKPITTPAVAQVKPAASSPAVHRTNGQPTANELAARARQKDCGRQWSAAKTAGKIPAGQSWPQYWSQCNKRMKG